MMHISLLSLKGKRHSLLTEKFLEVLRQETQEIEEHRVAGGKDSDLFEGKPTGGGA